MNYTKNKKKGLELKRIVKGDKAFRGAFAYYRNDNIYAEEEFEVWHDRKEFTLSFFAKLHARVATGEVLTVYVDYTVSKDFTPQHVLIERSLGKEQVTEVYDFDRKKNLIDYFFITKKNKNHCQISTTPKFHISTPVTTTSLIFLKSKKIDATAVNYFQTLQSYNNWSFVKAPSTKALCIQRMSLGTENVIIDGNNIQATEYKIYEDIEASDSEENFNPPTIRAYLSKHASIPYLVKSDDGTRVQIKYLNELDAD